MAPVCAHTLRTMAYSSDVSRFVREYPTRIAAYGPKLLLKIVTTADLFENVKTYFPSSGTQYCWIHRRLTESCGSLPFILARQGIYQVICMLTNLIAIYNALWIQDRMSQDKTNTVDLFQVPPSLRLQLKTRYARMKSYGSAHETEPEKVAYDQALSDLGLALFPEMYVVRRGTDYIDGEIASEGYLPWWACEARHPHTGVSGPGRACDAGARDQLRVCDRVSACPEKLVSSALFHSFFSSHGCSVYRSAIAQSVSPRSLQTPRLLF